MTFRKNQVQPPCKGCSDRCVSCHSTCEKYAKYKDAVKQVKTDYFERNKTEWDFKKSICSATYKRIYG